MYVRSLQKLFGNLAMAFLASIGLFVNGLETSVEAKEFSTKQAKYVKKTLKKCKQGKVEFCMDLGKFYESGQAGEIDQAHASKYYQMACEDDARTGCKAVVRLYQDPDNPDKDESSLIELCDKNILRVCNAVIKMNLDTENKDRDEDIARKYSQKLCDMKKYSSVQYNVIWMKQLCASFKKRPELDAFVNKIDASPDVTKTNGGLRYRILNSGSGVSPTQRDIVLLSMVATDMNGIEKKKKVTEINLLHVEDEDLLDLLKSSKTGSRYELIVVPQIVVQYENFFSNQLVDQKILRSLNFLAANDQAGSIEALTMDVRVDQILPVSWTHNHANNIYTATMSGAIFQHGESGDSVFGKRLRYSNLSIVFDKNVGDKGELLLKITGYYPTPSYSGSSRGNFEVNEFTVSDGQSSEQLEYVQKELMHIEFVTGRKTRTKREPCPDPEILECITVKFSAFLTDDLLENLRNAEQRSPLSTVHFFSSDRKNRKKLGVVLPIEGFTDAAAKIKEFQKDFHASVERDGPILRYAKEFEGLEFSKPDHDCEWKLPIKGNLSTYQVDEPLNQERASLQRCLQSAITTNMEELSEVVIKNGGIWKSGVSNKNPMLNKWKFNFDLGASAMCTACSKVLDQRIYELVQRAQDSEEKLLEFDSAARLFKVESNAKYADNQVSFRAHRQWQADEADKEAAHNAEIMDQVREADVRYKKEQRRQLGKLNSLADDAVRQTESSAQRFQRRQDELGLITDIDYTSAQSTNSGARSGSRKSSSISSSSVNSGSGISTGGDSKEVSIRPVKMSVQEIVDEWRRNDDVGSQASSASSQASTVAEKHEPGSKQVKQLWDLGLSDENYGEALDKAMAKADRVCGNRGGPANIYHENTKAIGFKFKTVVYYNCKDDLDEVKEYGGYGYSNR